LVCIAVPSSVPEVRRDLTHATASKQAPLSAIVIGGSIGGLAAALALRQAGMAVEVFERAATPLAGRGAGINTHPELVAALDRLGVPTGAGLGVASHWRRMLSADGSVTDEFPREQLNTSWDRLQGLLRTALPDAQYHLGRAFVGVEPRGARVLARFADGGTAEADLLVGADGFRSTVRATLLPGVEPSYVGYVAWRGMAEERALSPAAHAAIFDAFAMGLSGGEEILGYPVAGADNALAPGTRRYNVVWYRPADAAQLARLLTDKDGRRHEVSIPPPLIAPELVAEALAAVRAHAPPLAEVVLNTPAPFLQPIYDCSVPRMVDGRVALIGDAAFVARPHVGGGVTKAVLDAVALADAIVAEGDLDRALARFEAARLRAGRAIIERTRWLGSILQLPSPVPPAQLPTPSDILRETAWLGWLRAGT
jgi:2-polyprenyl-6-methoxyphenol hydroxylase-like FAD-dependent oxidoreductase